MSKNRLCYFSLAIVALLCLMPGISVAQTIRVEGTVTNELGEALAGATVSVKGSPVPAITNNKGYYLLPSAAKGGTLVVSYLGYLTQEVGINASVIDVTLQPDNQVLSEVVVIGYGQQKKVTLTGAVSNVGGKDLLKSPTSNLGNALSGRLPGVQAVQYSGMPGEDTPDIRIRGVGTLNNSKPLVMVDGVERDFMQIDPNEVADISILKDASATAVFGVRGANGVILVTTKRGTDGKPSVSFSAQGGVQSITRFIKTTDSYDYAMAYNGAQLSDGVDPAKVKYTPDAVEHFKKGDQPMLFPNTNWLNYIMKPRAWQQQYNVNVSGGNAIAKYFVSLGMLDQDGLFKSFGSDPEANFKFRRYNYRANLDLNLSKYSQLSVNIGGRVENRNEIGDGEKNLFRYIQEAVPMAGYGLDSQGRRIVSDPLLVGKYNNDGLARFYNMGYKKKSQNVLNLDLQYTLKMDFLSKGLSFRVKGAYNSHYVAEKNRKHDHGASGVTYIAKDVATAEQQEQGVHVVDLVRGNGTVSPLPYSEKKEGGRDWYAEASFDYNRDFGKHTVGALVLYNQSKRYYPWEGYRDIPRGYVGLVGRVTYAYDTRYLLDVNAGYNGSENFAPGKRFGFFPSASLGWIVSNEKFWESVKDVISYVKLRASVGMVGNDAPNYSASNKRFLYLSDSYKFLNNRYDDRKGEFNRGLGGANFGTTNTNWLLGAKEETVGNPNVTWEKAVKQNYGIDLALFNNRLSINFDYFIEDRRDILVDNSISQPAIFGMPTYQENFGRVKNQGWEVAVKWEDRKGDFYYSIAPSVTFARNKIVEIRELDYGYPSLFRTGQAVGQTFGREFFEFYEPGKTEERYLKAYPDAFGGKFPDQGVGQLKPGDAVYVDLTGDGEINNMDEKPLGYSDIPEFNAALNLNFGWKGFDVSMVWVGATNVNRWLGYSFWRPQFGAGSDYALNQWVFDHSWTEQTASTATLPRLTFSNVEHNIVNSRIWMVDGSYIRLKSAEIGYTFRNIPRIPQIGSIRLYVSGYNLLTFSRFTGNDPEAGGGAWDEFVKYPMTRVINFGVNVNF